MAPDWKSIADDLAMALESTPSSDVWHRACSGENDMRDAVDEWASAAQQAIAAWKTATGTGKDG